VSHSGHIASDNRATGAALDAAATAYTWRFT
jgi:hypothetical protein